MQLAPMNSFQSSLQLISMVTVGGHYVWMLPWCPLRPDKFIFPRKPTIQFLPATHTHSRTPQWTTCMDGWHHYMHMHLWFTLSRAQLNHIHLLLLGKVNHYHINHIALHNVAGLLHGAHQLIHPCPTQQNAKGGEGTKSPRPPTHAYTCTLYM